MSESQTQINFDQNGHVRYGDYPHRAIQESIELMMTDHAAAESNFQSVVDRENLNSKYTQQLEDVNAYFSTRRLTVKPIRVVSEAIRDKAYAAAGEGPTEDTESETGRYVHGRTIVVEDDALQDIFGDDYILGNGLHESAHSLASVRVITTSREFSAPSLDGRKSRTLVTIGGIETAGHVKADFRRSSINARTGDFWEEAFADLTRVRGLRYLHRGNVMEGEPKSFDMEGVPVIVLPSGYDNKKTYGVDYGGQILPVEFAIVAKTKADGENAVGVAPSNLAAYALELLDSRVPGLYDDMEAATYTPKRQADMISKIESVLPGLYRSLSELNYTEQDFALGLQTVLDALGAGTVSTK